MKTTLPYDVSRCAGHLCPDRETCLRHTAEPPEVGRDVPQMVSFNRGEKCEYWIDNEKAHAATWEATATALLERAEKAEWERDKAREDASIAEDYLKTEQGEALSLDKQLREARADLARERDAHRALVKMVNGKEA